MGVIAQGEYRIPFESRPTEIVDAGANIGLAAVWFAANYPEARVTAIEPDKANFDLLVEDTSGYKNVVPIRGALWSFCGDLQLNDPG